MFLKVVGVKLGALNSKSTTHLKQKMTVALSSNSCPLYIRIGPNAFE